MRSIIFIALLMSMTAVSGDVRAAQSDAAVLMGSPSALADENRVADEYQLERFKDRDAIKAAIARGDLVAITPNGTVSFADELGAHDSDHASLYAYARPWVKAFLDDLAAAPTRPVGAQCKVTSLVRSEAYQRVLRRTSVTAASGSTPNRRSSHLTGSTVDITTKDMPEDVKEWMRRRLAAMERAGLILATEEKYGSLCFHIMIRPDYGARKRGWSTEPSE